MEIQTKNKIKSLLKDAIHSLVRLDELIDSLAVENRSYEYVDKENRALDEGKSRREVMRDVLGLTDAEIDAIMGETSVNRESPKWSIPKSKYFVRSNI